MTPKHRTRPPAGVRAISGAVVAAIAALVFLSFRVTIGAAVPWSALVPLMVVTVAGALGGVAFSVTEPMRHAGGWKRTAANALSVFFYCVIVSAAFVAALKGRG